MHHREKIDRKEFPSLPFGMSGKFEAICFDNNYKKYDSFQTISHLLVRKDCLLFASFTSIK